MKKGDTLVCGSCGFAVTVCDECDCETQELICCGEPMALRKPAKRAPRVMRKATKKRK